MEIKETVWLHAYVPEGENTERIRFIPYVGKLEGNGFTPIAPREVVWHDIEPDHYIAPLVAALREEQAKLRAETEMKAGAIEARIGKLLAIEG